MQMGGVGGAQQQWKTCPRCRQRNPKEGPNNHIVYGQQHLRFCRALLLLGWRMSLAEAVLSGRLRLCFCRATQRCWAGQSKSVWLLKLCRHVCSNTYECRAAGLVSQSLSGC